MRRVARSAAGLAAASVVSLAMAGAAQAPKPAARPTPTPKPTPRPTPPPVGIGVLPDESARRVDVTIDGQPFTSYIWPESQMKPALYPILTEKGAAVTRGFPLDPRPGERTDHPHQVGLWLSYGSVNGIDFWNNSTARKPEEQAKMGRTRQAKVLEAAGGPAEGKLRVAAEWVVPGDEVVLDEDTTFAFRVVPAGRLIERTTILTAKVPVVFADNKEGFFGMRVARGLEHPSREPAIFTDAEGRPTTVPVLDNTAATGLYRSSEGKEGDEVWGTRGRWVALSGRVGAESVTVAILDHPKNPGAPTYWHARGYGLFAANPLGQKELSGGKDELNLKLDEGKSATFRYLLLVTSKGFAAPAVEELWKDFAKR